jgi:hypothetical protein
MKLNLFFLTLFISFWGFSQSKKDNKEINFLKKQRDSLELAIDEIKESIVIQRDSLRKIINELTKKKDEGTKKKKTSDDFLGDYILIGSNKWASTNFGGAKLNPSNDNTDDWLSENGYERCTSENEWIDMISSEKPAYFVLEEPLFCVGYFFNSFALKKLQENPPKGWRIADFNDFIELYNYTTNLKLKTTSPFQLLVSNYSLTTNLEAKKKLTWTNQTINDIYNLSLYPVSYFSGFVSLLSFNTSLNLFSRYDEVNNKIYYTEVSPNNKLLPSERRFGSEAYDYGFLVRLIKN